MDPDTSDALAAWAGTGVAALFGLAGLIVGIIGLVQANRARADAAESNRIAARANDLATGANSLASGANTIAVDANDLAVRANEISVEATELVRAAELRATELHDVRWEGLWESPGMYLVKNVGIHKAHQVVVQIRFSGAVEVAEVEEVGSGAMVRIEVPRAREVYEEAVNRSGIRRSPGMTIVRAGPGRFPVEERIFWRTPGGVPREHAAERDISLKPKLR